MMNKRFLSLLFFIGILFLLINIKFFTASYFSTDLDHKQIEQLTGCVGTPCGSSYHIKVPRNDVTVSIDNFPITPGFALYSWFTFTPFDRGCMVFGTLVLRVNERLPVELCVTQHGFTITSIYQQFPSSVSVIYMTIQGFGNVTKTAQSVRAILDTLKTTISGIQKSGPLTNMRQTSGLDTNSIDDIFGVSGTYADNLPYEASYFAKASKDRLAKYGVYTITIERANLAVTEHGIPLNSCMGVHHWMAFQGTQESAAVTGYLVVTPAEIAGTVRTLTSNNIEVTAIVTHFLTEQPRIYFVHFWGTGPLLTIAQGLRAACDQIGC